jgi:hypothetical protein
MGQQLSEAGRRLICAGSAKPRSFAQIPCFGSTQISRGLPMCPSSRSPTQPLKPCGKRAASGPHLATRFTVEGDFYTGRLQDVFGIEAMIPDEAAREQIHPDHLRRTVSGRGARREPNPLSACHRDDAPRGADSVILGCTEITMLIGASDSELPLFDRQRTDSRLSGVRRSDKRIIIPEAARSTLAVPERRSGTQDRKELSRLRPRAV